MTPELMKLLYKVIGFAAIILLTGIAIHEYGVRKYDAGAADTKAKWDADRLTQERAYNEALARRSEENIQMAEDFRKKLVKQKKGYADEIAEIDKRSAESADAGLRLPATVCASAATAGAAEAGSASGGDAGAAATVLLPRPTERDLRALMEKAGKVIAGCRVAQDFIKQNGFAEQQ